MTIDNDDNHDNHIKFLKKVAKTFENRNGDVVPLHCEKQHTMHRSAMQQAENGNAARCKRQRSKVQKYLQGYGRTHLCICNSLTIRFSN